jgi:hypothetical protein
MAENQQQLSVADLIGRLRFVSSAAPAVYLNERLAKEMFIAQLGAIASFARQAAKGASGGIEGGASFLKVKVGASTDASQQVNYEINDPLTRALILHSALGGTTALAATTTSHPGAFAEAIGPIYLPPVTPDPPTWARDAVTTVKSETSEQTDALRALGNTETTFLSLLLLDERRPVGAIIDRQWLRDGTLVSYRTHPQVVFGIVEQVIHDLPLLHLIYMRPYL